jgi:hypothetical protein
MRSSTKNGLGQGTFYAPHFAAHHTCDGWLKPAPHGILPRAWQL